MPDQHTMARREFLKTTPLVIGGLGLLAQQGFAEKTSAPGPVTTGDVIENILNQFGGGVDRLDETIDTIKTGDAARPVNGIVTTFMATTDVIQRVIQHNADFIITHEPTFYGHFDETDWLKNDPVYQHKRKLLDDHGITVWRYHDHIHKIKPDPIFTGLIERLGWADMTDPDDGRICHITQTTLAELTEHCKQKLGMKAMNYVGNPDMPCAHIGLLPGAHGGQRQIGLLSEGNIDVVICGEVAEWETNEYVRDSQHTGKPLGLIVTGHQASEEDGMQRLADWLNAQYPDITTTHIPAGDSFTHA